MPLILWISIAGVCGVLSRYAAGKWLGAAPVPTFLVNLTGCFAIGLVYTLLLEPSTLATEPKRTAAQVTTGIALLVGFLGGFTTFSSYALETVVLWEGGKRTIAMAYAVASPMLGLVCAVGGMTLGRFIFSR